MSAATVFAPVAAGPEAWTDCALHRCGWLNRYSVQVSPGRRYRFAKRNLDVVVALVVLVITLPVLAAAAIAIKLTSRGPVLYAQSRAGRRGESFRLYKLRTMVPDADRRKSEILHLNSRQWPDFKVARDPRVTRVGRLLRASSIDELPQLVNVLRGEMSLVGPRPTSLMRDGYHSWQLERFGVKPGITGLWQVTARADSSFDTRVRLDIAYATRRGFVLDAEILLRTLPAVFRGRGAY